MRRLTWRILLRSTLLATGVSVGLSGISGQPLLRSIAVAAEDAGAAATVDEATKVLDLSTLPLAEGAKVSFGRHLGSVTYEVAGDLKTAFQFHQEQLTKLGWKELPGAASQAEYISVNFQKGGFTISVASYVGSDPAKPKSAIVSITNLGNVRLSKLPSVTGAKQVFATDVNASYSTTLKLTEAIANTRKLLSDAGWEPYGSINNPPDSEIMTFKRNAVRLIAFVGNSPVQKGQVMISYSSTLMAADIPAPPNAKEVGFEDTQKLLTFQSPDSFDDVAKYYQQRLPKMGWKPTTNELTKNKFGNDRPLGTLVFRNGANDVLSLDLTTDDGKSHAKLKHLSAAEIAAAENAQRATAEKLVAKNKKLEEDAQSEVDTKKPAKKPTVKSDDAVPDVDALVKDAIGDALKEAGLSGKKPAKAAPEKAADKDSVNVPIPEGAKKVTQTSGNVLQIKWPAGKGKASAEALRDQLLAAGWEMGANDKIEKISGNVTFKNDGKQLTLSFVDTGFTDVNMMLIGIGVKLTEGKADPNAKVAETKPTSKPKADPSAEPEDKPTKKSTSKPSKSNAVDSKTIVEPARPAKPQRGIAKLEKLPGSAKLIVDGKPVSLPNIIAYEMISDGRWVTKIVGSAKPISQPQLLELLQKKGTDSGLFVPAPQMALTLDDQDRPIDLKLAAEETIGGGGRNDIDGEVIVEEGRARGSVKLKEPSKFFGHTINGEFSFDLPVLKRDDKPAKRLADLPKLETSGTLLVNGKPIKLGSVIAYEVKIFDGKQTAIFFTEKPINMAKLKASLAKDGTDDSVFETQSQVKIMVDKFDTLSMLHLWHDNASLSTNNNIVGDVVVEDGRARGTAKLSEPKEVAGKTYLFELTFDVEVLKLPETDKE